MDLGPHDATLQVLTGREGMAARAGHDLVLKVTRWEATADLDAGTAALTADPRSLLVREGRGGVKPLTDGDRRQIARTMDEKVLRGQPIEFRADDVRRDGDAIVVAGELTLAGRTRPLTVTLRADGDRLRGTVTVVQSDWGISPYRGMMGALRVRDAVDVVLDAPAR